ncbi:MAG: hypothetical protein AAGG59_16490, partial [Bacteroidota bacterium]
MKRKTLITLTALVLQLSARAQNIVLDTSHLQIQARAYVLEKHKGVDAIYLQGGAITAKNVSFLNGTIEYDIFLKEERGFPGVYFRGQDDTDDAEYFYIRPHQSGNPDANQAIPRTRGISPWQLYYGARYSFPYDYHYNDWTHVKLVVLDDKAQVFLDHSEQPNLSWNLFHEAKGGKVVFTGGNASGLHLANLKIDHQDPTLVDFKPITRKPIDDLINSWQISDMFEEKLLDNPDSLELIIKSRKWTGKVEVEEGTAANISRIRNLRGAPGNTVFARVEINSERDHLKLLEFGYSDRAVLILNGKPIYRGTNRFQSRDYRYLGTVGLFDAVYLDLNKGKNTLLIAVSEDFGGWLVTARIQDKQGIKI